MENRRDFLKTLGLGSIVLAVPLTATAVVNNAVKEIKIKKVSKKQQQGIIEEIDLAIAHGEMEHAVGFVILLSQGYFDEFVNIMESEMGKPLTDQAGFVDVKYRSRNVFVDNKAFNNVSVIKSRDYNERKRKEMDRYDTWRSNFLDGHTVMGEEFNSSTLTEAQKYETASGIMDIIDKHEKKEKNSNA